MVNTIPSISKEAFSLSFTNSIDERNELIVNEIMEYHKNGYPVLAIFLSPKEIDTIKSKIESHAIYLKYKVDIGVYGGQGNKPNERAGKEGSITLGTNICGRGTDIKCRGKPLHVIVTYYSSNIRVMNQAFGRTGRQGASGSCRVICLDTQYYSPTYILGNVNNTIDEFFIKNKSNFLLLSKISNISVFDASERVFISDMARLNWRWILFNCRRRCSNESSLSSESLIIIIIL